MGKITAIDADDLIRACLGAALLLATAVACPARAEPIADFYAGRTVNLLIGVDVGGEYDTIARLVGRHIGRHIPGAPGIVAQNMVGASGIRMANHLATIAPQDGSAIGMMSNELPMNDAMGNPGIQFKTATLNWIGSVAPLVEVLILRSSLRVGTIEELKRGELTVGTPTRTSIHNYLAGILVQYFGAKLRMVTGYAGGNATDLALERGEVDGRVVAWSAIKVTKSDWIRDKTISVIAQFGPTAADLPAVANVSDLATDATQRQVIALLVSPTRLGRPLATGPGVPADRVAALRRAFDATMRDPAFLADAAAMRIEVWPFTGEALQQVAREVFATPPDIVALAKKMNE